MRAISTVTGSFLLALLPLASQAGPPPEPSSKFYVGLDIGSSQLDAALSTGFFGPAVSQPSGDDVGFKARFGIQISRYFAVEAGYTDFGEFTVENIPYLCAPASPPPCTFNVSSGTQGPSTNFVAIWPFAENWALSGRVGAQYAEVSTSERDPDVPGSARSFDDSSWGLLYGAGLSYRLSPRMTLALNWERNDQIEFGVNLGGGAGVYDLGSSSLTSLGFAYRF